MFSRMLSIDLSQSVLLLGARGTGKSTFIKSALPIESTLWIDLLIPKLEDRYSRDPSRLIDEVKALGPTVTTVVIDEIQKIPALLDVVHLLIESTDKIFILTGSSARKLRAGSANLLAGRALAYSFFPLTSYELGDVFELKRALENGTLPKIWNLKTASSQRKTLETYALTYLNEEIRAEQAVRSLDPFRKFLEVAAQCNGKIINFSSIAKDVDVDEKTVRNYYQVLEDTLVGFFIEPYDSSVRKKIGKSPKFFFFDTGVTRALARNLTVELRPSTYAWGDAFEHFVILEMTRLISYSGNQFSLNFLRTYDDLEIDIIVKRPGKSTLLIEIKSTEEVRDSHLKHLKAIGKDFDEPHEKLCFSNEQVSRIIDDVKCMYWQIGLREYFTGPDLL